MSVGSRPSCEGSYHCLSLIPTRLRLLVRSVTQDPSRERELLHRDYAPRFSSKDTLALMPCIERLRSLHPANWRGTILKGLARQGYIPKRASVPYPLGVDW